MPEESGVLAGLLAESAALGFLGTGPASAHLEHSLTYVAELGDGARVLDLGAGGGVPGLVIAVERPDLDLVLLDSSVTRTDFLRRAAGRLDLGARLRIVTGRAELVVRQEGWRGSFDAVVARSFGPPAVVAEVGAPFLRVGGRLVVSEPPGDVDRWPGDGLGLLGLRRVDALSGGVAVLEQVSACPSRFPRRSLRPPLFGAT